MKLSINAGATGQSISIFVRDSSSTTGGGLTGLVFNTAGLVAYYTFAGPNATAVAITLATLAAVNSAWSSGGFKEIDAANMPGWYRLDLPDAALAASKGRSVAIHLKGATNMAPVPIEIELTGWNNQDGVRGGLTALPNAAAGANGGLPTGDANARVQVQPGTAAGQISMTAGIVDGNAKQWNGTTVDLTHLGIIGSGTAGTITAGTGGVAGSATAVLTGVTAALEPGALVLFWSATTGTGQIRPITAWNSGTSTASFDPLTVALTGTVLFKVFAGPGAGLTPPDVNVTKVGGTTQTAGDLAALISSRLAAAGYTAPDNATIALIYGKVDTEIASIITTLGTPAGASLAADIAAVPAAVQTSATTTPLKVDLKKINGTTVNGDGAATPWGP